MKQFVVTKSDENQRFSKYLGRILKESGSSFIYKMLRKKNITLNDGKATGNELLKSGDIVKLFLSDETFEKFSGGAFSEGLKNEKTHFSDHPVQKESIAYEDEHLILCYKPAGILSQKDTKEGESINEQLLQYLLEEGTITAESLRLFKPGICNRLDRNTSGLVLFAKTLAGQQVISEALKTRSLKKYYLAFVSGPMQGSFEHKGYLTKDSDTNTVTISEENLPNSEMIHTIGNVLYSNSRVSLLQIELVTGKSHQIRSVMEYLGHPVLGDPKYYGNDASERREILNRYGIKYQMLLCYRYDFPELREPLQGLCGKKVFSPIPKTMASILQEEFPGMKIPRG